MSNTKGTLLEQIDTLSDRLEAVLTRERCKDERIKELEGIITKLQNSVTNEPKHIKVTHSLEAGMMDKFSELLNEIRITK